MEKIEEDWNGLKLWFFKNISSNNFLKLIIV